jgi:hypothetical protein
MRTLIAHALASERIDAGCGAGTDGQVLTSKRLTPRASRSVGVDALAVRRAAAVLNAANGRGRALSRRCGSVPAIAASIAYTLDRRGRRHPGRPA